MCNAWNHPPGCACGWGGVGHQGRGTGRQQRLFSYWPPGIPPISASIQSITIPNAKCPVCGESVFYYCNEYGSSVFFDELGPPWPKHPCTDNNTPSPPKILSIQGNTASKHYPSWKTNGWLPYQVEGVAEIDQNTFKLSLRSIDTEEELVLYVSSQSIVYSKGIRELFPRESIVFVQQVKEHYFRVSGLTPKLKTFHTEAYDSLIALRRAPKPAQKKHRKKTKAHKKTARQHQPKKKPQEKPATSMSLAFDKANEEKHNQ